LKELYKTKVKSPLFSIDFFMRLIKLENAKILVVKFNERIIGGIVIVLLGRSTVSEWFVCGDDGIEKNLYPSVLATYAGIEYAAKNGFERFDFMGAGKPDEDYGVREFKSKFGGELVEHGRFLYICKPMLYTLGKFIIQMMKKRKV
jgi:serine/alanine adding enzyme